MTVLNPPTWSQHGTYDARNDRLHISSLLDAVGATSPTDFAIAQTLVASNKITVAAGAAYIESGYQTGQGYYCLVNDAPIELTVAPGDSTNPRIDRVVARIYDSWFAGNEVKADIEIVRGDPAVSPALPTMPLSSIELGRISVAAGATTVVTANINNTVMPLTSLKDSLVQDGTGAWTSYTPTFTGITLGSGTVNGKYRVFGKTVNILGRFIYGAGSAVGTNPTMTLPIAAVGATSHILGTLGLFDSGTTYQVGWARWGTATTAFLMPTSGLGITATVPWTWATGDTITWNLTYETT